MLTPFEKAAVEAAPNDSRVRRLVEQHGTADMRHALQLLDRIGDENESARRCWRYAQAVNDWEDRGDWLVAAEEHIATISNLGQEYRALVGGGA